jgi:hypothetical protein
MLEARTEDNKPFQTLCFKEPDYVMKTMALWMTLDDMEGATNTRRECEGAGSRSLVK